MNISKWMNQLNPKIRIISILGVILMIYGFIAKLSPMNFFWESSELGFLLLAGSLGVIVIVELGIKTKILSLYYRTGWRTFFHGMFILLIIGIQTMFYFSDSFAVAKKELMLNEELNKEVGNITGFGWIVSGSNSTVSSSEGELIFANYKILVKGTKAYQYVLVAVERKNSEPWKVQIISFR